MHICIKSYYFNLLQLESSSSEQRHMGPKDNFLLFPNSVNWNVKMVHHVEMEVWVKRVCTKWQKKLPRKLKCCSYIPQRAKNCDVSRKYAKAMCKVRNNENISFMCYYNTETHMYDRHGGDSFWHTHRVHTAWKPFLVQLLYSVCGTLVSWEWRNMKSCVWLGKTSSNLLYYQGSMHIKTV